MKNIFLCLCLMSTASFAFDDKVYYRYINDEGNVVIDYQVPPELVRRGYEIISAQGEVLEEIPAFNSDNKLTASEIETREQQRKTDVIMLRSYSTVEDLYRVRDRKVVSLQQEVSIIDSNIKDLTTLLDRERKDAANIQRSGQAVSGALQLHIDTLVEQIADAKNMLALRTTELQEMKTFYRNQITRFRILKGLDEEPEQTAPDEVSATDQATGTLVDE